ncbi:MAG TPA: serine/threonine protein kinase, partial [Polyangiaceae bacterium]|nr:serine/threonine protein kinase [Polyangiaceae bacterium]
MFELPEETEADRMEQTLLLSGFTQGVFFMERYRLEALLGQGAMGKVFRATDTIEDRRVAVKVLHPDMARKTQVLARFRREFEILRELGHPGIVRVYDAGQAPDGMDYLIMEFLEGRTLKRRLQRDGPMTPDEFLPLLVQVCDALGSAHVQGVVHRDLKPDNLLLLTGDEVVKVVDFGLSRLATEKRMTKTGIMLGTPRYMPPEQIRSAKDADARTDQYALAVITHEALAGASPFPAADAGQLLGCVIEGRILPLEEQRPGISKRLGDVVRKAMSREPRDRYATIGAYVEAYAHAIGRDTGRSSLVAGDAISDLFRLADGPDASGEVELPDAIISTPAYEIPKFTLPEGGEIAPVPMPPAAEPAPTRRAWGLALFLLALVAVVLFSAAGAYGMRLWMNAGGQTDGISVPI